MDKLYYSIGEVAAMLGEQVSLVRFWSDRYPRLFSPRRNAKGTRRYEEKDVETFKQLHYLVKDKGMKLDGAVRQLLGERSGVDARVKVLDSLKSLRARLVELKKTVQ